MGRRWSAGTGGVLGQAVKCWGRRSAGAGGEVLGQAECWGRR
ncbi:hypothetical protein [Paenibacillus sp. FSL R10-2771]